MIVVIVGIMVELIKGEWSFVNKVGYFLYLNNFSYVIMFIIFLLFVVVEILCFYNILFLFVVIDYVLFLLLFFLVGEFFYFYIDGCLKFD